MKRNLGFFIQLRETAVVKVMSVHLSLLRKCSKMIRVMNTAVNNEASKPIINVVAKPRIGPVPK